MWVPPRAPCAGPPGVTSPDADKRPEAGAGKLMGMSTQWAQVTLPSPLPHVAQLSHGLGTVVSKSLWPHSTISQDNDPLAPFVSSQIPCLWMSHTQDTGCVLPACGWEAESQCGGFLLWPFGTVS